MTINTIAPLTEATEATEATVNQVFSVDAPPVAAFGLEMLRRQIAEYEERMTSPAVSLAEQTKSELLKLTLMTGVPLCVHSLKAQGGPTEIDIEFCHRFGWRIGAQADRLQFRSKGEFIGDKDEKRVEAGTDTQRYHFSTGELMVQMIRAVSIMAFFPGGVTVFGLHFEAQWPRAEKAETANILRRRARFHRKPVGRRR